MDLLALDERVGDELIGIQIFLIHIDGGNLGILVSGVIVNAAVHVAAGGVDGVLVLVPAQVDAAFLLVNRSQDMEELADAGRLGVRRQGVHLGKCHFDKT